MKLYMPIIFLVSIFYSCMGWAEETAAISNISNGGKQSVVREGEARCGKIKFKQVPQKLEGVLGVYIGRGDSKKEGEGFSFEVDKSVSVYLFIDSRKNEEMDRKGWTETDLAASWLIGDDRIFTDIIVVKKFPAGKIEIPQTPKGVLPCYAAVVVE